MVGDDRHTDLVLQLDLPVDEGAYVVDVSPDGRPRPGVEAGDVIVRFDGEDVTGQQQLGDLIHAHQPGDEVEVVGEARRLDRCVHGRARLNPGPVLEP